MTFYSSIVVGFADQKHGLFVTGMPGVIETQLFGDICIIAFTSVTTLALMTMMKLQRRFKFGQVFEIVG